MKIDLNFAVDIDPDRWAEEYNLDPNEVPQDVQRHVTNIAVAHLDSLGLLATGGTAPLRRTRKR